MSGQDRIKVFLAAEGTEARLIGTIRGFDIQPVGKDHGRLADGAPVVKLLWIDDYGQPKVTAIHIATESDVDHLIQLFDYKII